MNRGSFATVSFNAQEYNANKKAAAKADSAAPAAEAVPSKKRKKSEDGGEKKKVAFRRDDDDWSLQIYVYKSFPPQRGLFMRFHRCTFHTEKEEV